MECRPKLGAAAVLALITLGCTPLGLSTSVGPTRAAIERSTKDATIQGLRIIDITQAVAAQPPGSRVRGDFAATFGPSTPSGSLVGIGDSLEITIWEAAPAALFGSSSLDTRVGSQIQGSRANTLPPLQVGPAGTISVPFAGQVPAVGRTLRQIERDIVARLEGQAHKPQAVVRFAENVTTNVTVLGDVRNPRRIALTPKGERLLDAIAEAGGTGQPLDRMTIQITRGGTVQRMAARDIIHDPQQNIVLRSDDVVAALYQPYSFTVLGAAGRNDEVRFEGVGLTLSQALGRIGGLQEDRADPEGLFIFRWELPHAVGVQATDPEDRVPIIYKADMKAPVSYFAAQRFEMRDGDVVYVSNSRLSDIQRFVSILAGSILPLSAVRTSVR